MSEIQISVKEQTMSSQEIAELTDKRHSDVMRDIRKILNDAEISERNYASTYKDEQGKQRPCYNLPRYECDLVVSGYSVKYRAAIIKRWHELEKSCENKVPVTYIQALEKLLESEKEKERVRLENEKLNTIIDNEFGYSSILRAATYAGVSEKEFNWRTLKRITLGLDMEIKRVPSPRYGYQNLYPIKAFEIAYPEIDFDDLKPESVDDKSKLAIRSIGNSVAQNY